VEQESDNAAKRRIAVVWLKLSEQLKAGCWSGAK
jgi:hypothetical protein